MEAIATARFVRMAPRKVRFVLDTIRGKYAQEALDLLRFTSNHAADEIANVVRSAMANAVNNHNMNGDYLKVARCFVDVGPTMKRVQPRAQGRAYRILKRTSHITVVVTEGTAPATTRPRELEIKKRGPKPPLRAPLPGATVAVAEDTSGTPVEDTTPVSVTVEEVPETVVEETPGANAAVEEGKAE